MHGEHLYDKLQEKFVKHDQEKAPMHQLLKMKTTMEQVATLLEKGAKKYSQDNWKKGCVDRYLSAALRHMYDTGNDAESGLPHVVHAIANLIFVNELTNGRETQTPAKRFSEAVTGGPVIYPEVPLDPGTMVTVPYKCGSPHGDPEQDGPYSDDYGRSRPVPYGDSKQKGLEDLAKIVSKEIW